MRYQAKIFFRRFTNIGQLGIVSVLTLLALALSLEARGVEQAAEPLPQPAAAPTQPVPAEPGGSAVQAPALTQPAAEIPLVDGLLQSADAPRNYWSDQLATFANDVDRFFGDPRYFQEANKSVVQIDIAQVVEPGNVKPTALDGQIKLDLPSTERRFSLMLESNPEKNLPGDTGKQRPVLATEVVGSDNQSAALRYEKPPEESRWHFSADTGVKVRMPPEPFVRSRASYALPMENWRMKAIETVFWFSSIGAGETTQVDFERALGEAVLFRATSTATWMNDNHNFDLRQDLSLYHTMNNRAAMLYQASVIGVSQPQLEATEYVLLMLYRYRLHKSWIFFELSPQLHYPKARDFDMTPMLLMRLEFLFDGSR